MYYPIFVQLRVCLFGEYYGPLSMNDTECAHIQNAQKNLKQAIHMLPQYFDEMYTTDESKLQEAEMLFSEVYMRNKGYDLCRYLPDLELQELVKDMENAGYSQTEISTFATAFVQEILLRKKICISSMYVLLFGKHVSGISVETLGAKNWTAAIDFVPQYIAFLNSSEASEYFSEGVVDLDDELNAFVKQMHHENFTDRKIEPFVDAWFDAIEKQEMLTLALLHVYLFGHYPYVDGNGNKAVVPLPQKQNFSKALSVLHKYVAYLQNYRAPWWDDDASYSPQMTLEKLLIPRMQSFGYSNEDIQIFKESWMSAIEKS